MHYLEAAAAHLLHHPCHTYIHTYIHTYKAVDKLKDRLLTVGIFTVWTSRSSFAKLDNSLEETLTYVCNVCIYVMYVCMYVNNKYHFSIHQVYVCMLALLLIYMLCMC
jgi:hypothetical protein